MAKKILTLPIVMVPDQTLSTPSEDVPANEFGEKLNLLIERMFLTMKEAPGVGLAAPQIGINWRLFVVDITYDNPEVEPFEVINPKVLRKSGDTSYEEGCLSIPGFFHEMKRSSEIDIKFIDRDQKPHQLKAKGFLAIVLQHELAHIEGNTIISHLSAMKQSMIVKKVRKSQRH